MNPPETPPAPADACIQPAPATAQPTSAPVRRRRWPKLLAGLLLLLAVPALLYTYLIWSNDRDLQDAVAETERLDPRWRLDQILADRPAITDEDNPAIVAKKVSDLMGTGFDVGQQNWQLFQHNDAVHRLNELQIRALRAAFEKYDEPLKLARTLKDFRGTGRFAIKISPDFLSTNLDPLQRCRGVMNLLQHDAMLRAEDEDMAGAMESCQAALVAARCIGDEPYLIAALIRIAGQNIAINSVERVLAQGEVPAPQLEAMQELLAREIDVPILIQAMRVERAGFDGLIDGLASGKIKLSMLRGGLGGNNFEDWLMDLFPSFTTQGRGDYLRLMNQAVEAAKLPLEKQKQAFTEVELATKNSRSIVVRLLVPALTKVSDAHRRTQSLLRCALVGVAVERYRMKHGHWPDALVDLTRDGLLKALPYDPCDGQALRYKRLADGVVIYSVGMDGVDNGGVLNRDNPIQPGVDLGFQLWDFPDARRRDPLPPPRNVGGDQP
jgi:competence protein ComGC